MSLEVVTVPPAPTVPGRAASHRPGRGHVRQRRTESAQKTIERAAGIIGSESLRVEIGGTTWSLPAAVRRRGSRRGRAPARFVRMVDDRRHSRQCRRALRPVDGRRARGSTGLSRSIAAGSACRGRCLQDAARGRGRFGCCFANVCRDIPSCRREACPAAGRLDRSMGQRVMITGVSRHLGGRLAQQLEATRTSRRSSGSTSTSRRSTSNARSSSAPTSATR